MTQGLQFAHRAEHLLLPPKHPLRIGPKMKSLTITAFRMPRLWIAIAWSCIALAWGYDELTQQAMLAASGPGTAEDKLIALAMNFVEFAMSSPRLLELMYESELTSPSPDEALLKYQHAGQSALMAQLRAARPQDSEDEASVRVIALWSSIYGFASLRRKQMIQTFEPQAINSDQVARRTMTLAVHAALRD